MARTNWTGRGVLRLVSVGLAIAAVNAGAPGADATVDRVASPGSATVSMSATYYNADGTVIGRTPVTTMRAKGTTSARGTCGSGTICGTPTASGCVEWHVWRTERHQGITDYRYEVDVTFCWHNRAIKRKSVRVTSSMSSIAANINDDGNTESDNGFYDYWYPIATSGHYSKYQRHVQYCGGWFCYDHEDPWIHVYVHGDGTMSFHTGTR